MWVLYLIGTLFAALGVFFLAEAAVFRRNATRYSGRVIGCETSMGNRGRTMYHPVVEYSDESGRRFIFKENIGTSPMPYELNQDVTVLVFKKMHATARVRGGGRILIGSIFTLVGLLVTGIGLIQIGSGQTLVTVSVSIMAVMSAALLAGLKIAARQYESMEKGFDYTPGENGVIGHGISESTLDTPVEVAEHAINPRWFLSGVILGATLMIVALIWANERSSFIDTASRATGKIVGQVSQRDSEGRITYRAVITFLPHTGEPVRFTSGMGSSHPSWKVGDSVDVLYAPGNPEDALEDRGGWWNYLAQLIMGAIGLIILAPSLIQYLKKRA